MGKIKEVDALKAFNQKKDTFQKEIQIWCDNELGDFSNSGGGTVWSHSPSIDSLSVVSAITVAEEALGIKFEPEEVILKGGYEDVYHFLEDFLPKVQAVFIEKQMKQLEKDTIDA